MSKLDLRIAELRAKLLPVRRAAFKLFGTPDGKLVLEALERAFVDELVPKDGNGAVDPNAVLVQVGARQVIDYLRKLSELEEETGT